MKNIFLTYSLFILSFGCFTMNLTAQCFDNGHSPYQNQGWLSCTKSLSPIEGRAASHWIMYDFGENYFIDSMYLWNHNVWGETGMGVKQILIDYSTDQSNWKSAGPFTIEKAPGSWKYIGTEGPWLENAYGRYFLITVINTWDDASSCAGFGEVKFTVGIGTDTQDEYLESQLVLSPNPVADMLRIDLPDDAKIENISIYNAVGQKIKTFSIPVENEILFSVQNLQAGMYYVTIDGQTGKESRPFVKVD